MLQRLLNDKDYLRQIRVIGIPLVIQNAISASVNLVDSLMVGSFGDISLAAVNLSNQYYFLFNMVIVGLVAGGAVMNAQFWGKGDTQNMHRVMGLQFIGCLIVGMAFSLMAWLIPERVMGIYTDDPAVIAVAARYINILFPSYAFFGFSYMYANAHRCTGNTRMPMIISGSCFILNVCFNFILIFGKFGFPQLGVTGAAISTLMARTLEVTLMLSLTYIRKAPVAATFRGMFDFDADLTRRTLSKMIPVMLNETLWSLGTNTYSTVYARISTASIAAYASVSPIDSIMFTIFIGIGDACAVMIGNHLGAGDKERALDYAKYTMLLAFVFSIIVGGLILIGRDTILSFYGLSPEAIGYAKRILMIMALSLWARTINYVLFIGVLRPGGDTTFCLLMDAGAMWCCGIPTAAILAFVFHLPITTVYFGVMLEEAIKLIFITRRFISRKWLNNLVAVRPASEDSFTIA